MKGTLLVLALLVTRELGTQMGENRKEGRNGLLDLCPTGSLPPPMVISAQLLARNLGVSWEITAQKSCRKPPRFSVFQWRERFEDGGSSVTHT